MSSSSNSERKALSQLQTKSNKKTIKKSSSLRFNEIDENEDSAKKAKLSARNSLDNSLFSVHEDDEQANNTSQLKSSASAFQIYEDKETQQKQQQQQVDKPKPQTSSIEIQCEIEDDNTYDQCEFTEEELEIKRKNPENYMKIIAQKIRVELHDQLEENKEVNFCL